MTDVFDRLSMNFTPAERRWLELALRLDFPNRDNILAQLSNCTVSRKIDSESYELLFDDVESDIDILSPSRSIVWLQVMREHGDYVAVVFTSWKQKVDSFYIYMPDRSILDLENTPFEDVKYDIEDYRQSAHEMALFVCQAIQKKEMREELRASSLKHAEVIRMMVASFDGETADKDFAVSLVSEDPFSISVIIDLGQEGADSFRGVARASLISDYFFTYVTVNGVSSLRFLGEGCNRSNLGSRFPNGVINYPNGHRLQFVWDALYGIGYKPLSSSAVADVLDVPISDLHVEAKGLTLFDVLFTDKALRI